MRARAPIVRQFMTRLPVEVERCATVAEAIRVMEAHDFRHMPVMSGSHLKGIVSQHDILEARIRLKDRLDQASLQDICQEDVLTVSPLALISDVAEQMLRRKVDSAIVMDGGFVVGIFTATDALRAVSELFSHSSSEA